MNYKTTSLSICKEMTIKRHYYKLRRTHEVLQVFFLPNLKGKRGIQTTRNRDCNFRVRSHTGRRDVNTFISYIQTNENETTKDYQTRSAHCNKYCTKRTNKGENTKMKRQFIQ